MVYGVWEHDFGTQELLKCRDNDIKTAQMYIFKVLIKGVWCMVYGVWCMVYGVWCMVYGVWSMVYGVWCGV